MPIRLKLIITYILSVLISAMILVLIIMGAVAGLMGRVSKTIVNNSRVDEVIYEVVDLLAEFKQAEDYDKEKLISPVFMREVDDRLSFFNSGLIVLYKGEYINMGGLPDSQAFYDDLLPIERHSIDFHHDNFREKDASEHVINYGDHCYFYFDHVFELNDEQVVYFIVTDVSDLNKSGEKAVKWVGFIILLLLLLIMSPLLIIIRLDIIKPLKKLDKGARNISQGNLDFKLESKNNNEVGRVVKSFDKMREQLKKSIDKQIQYEENRKELISSISHDLKTPITSIKGYVEGILDGVANSEEKRTRYLKVIHQKSLDMDRLIDDLFLFSKLDLNRIPFDFRKVSMKKFADDMFEEMLCEYKEKAVIHYEYDNKNETPPIVSIDQGQMKRVFQNIIQNGIKYNQSKTKEIHIKLINHIDFIKLSIQDNGIGMNEDELQKVFEMFYRADVSRGTTDGGTGLGLAIAKQIVEEHQGTIEAKSKKGEGTTIAIILNKVKEVSDNEKSRE